MSQYSARRSGLFVPSNTILTESGWRSLVNADVSASAAIAYSKLNLGTSIVNADVSASAAIAMSKLANGTKGYGALATATGALYEPLPRKNRIMNGDFNVNQRGTPLTMVDNSFGVDRWRMLIEGGTQSTGVTPTSGYGNPQNASYNYAYFQQTTTANKLGMMQVIEGRDCYDLRGQAVSLQFKIYTNVGAQTDMRASILYQTGTMDSVSADPITTWGASTAGITTFNGWTVAGTTGALVPTSTWTTYKLENITINAAATNVAVILWCDDNAFVGDTCGFLDVQLEKGTICTEFERIPYHQQLLNCQRYYEAKVGVSGAAFGSGMNFNTTQALIGMPFVEKRGTPTATYGTAGTYQLLKADGSFVACSAISTYAISTHSVTMSTACASGLVAGNGSLFAALSASAKIEIAAEI